MGGLFKELQRRNVFRVGMLYLVFSWLILQVADVVFGIARLPEWSLTLVAVILGLGFVPALVISWIYELTPEGLKREAQVDRSSSISRETGRRINAAILIVLTIAVVMLGISEFAPGLREAAEPAPAARVEQVAPAPAPGGAAFTQEQGRKSIAVLPFVNMSEDAGNEYFSEGISEELLNVLVKVDDLRVPSRTSSFAFKGSNQSIGSIADQLGVDHILEGSVRKAGNQVRVTAQLIDVHSDTHLWSETYTRTLDDIFAIQDEIAQAIVDALRIKLGAGEAIEVNPTESTQAYTHYLRGRHLWHQRTGDAFRAAERELRAAVDLDPGYAKAWAALADIYVLQPEYDWSPAEVALPKAREALERALAINAESAQALTARGYLRYLYEWDFEAAIGDFEAAIALDPNYATAFQWYAELLATLRRTPEALQMALQAYKLDPLSPVKPMIVGNILEESDRFEEALTYYDKSLELAPNWFNTLFNLIGALARKGHYQEALDATSRLEASLAWEPGSAPFRAAIEAMAGTRPLDEAVATIRDTAPVACTVTGAPWWLALLGAYEEAITMLERCLDKGDPYATYMNFLAPFEPMRSMPRFQVLLERVNLPVEDDS